MHNNNNISPKTAGKDASALHTDCVLVRVHPGVSHELEAARWAPGRWKTRARERESERAIRTGLDELVHLLLELARVLGQLSHGGALSL